MKQLLNYRAALDISVSSFTAQNVIIEFGVIGISSEAQVQAMSTISGTLLS
jgi:hypothetical protein